MITKLTSGALLILLISSCAQQQYLPELAETGINRYGSYIKLKCVKGPSIKGELIAIDSVNFVVLEEEKKKCVLVPVSKVFKFSLQYAKKARHGWSIPVYSLFTVSHGFFAVASMPINLIATSAITANGKSAYVYDNRHITYEQLRMFARYPQGIPAGISIDSIQ